MGNITGAMVFQSAIPVSVALVFAPESWVAGQGSYMAFASAGIAFLVERAIFMPMARAGRLRGRGLLVGGAFYLAYLAIVGSTASTGPAIIGPSRSARPGGILRPNFRPSRGAPPPQPRSAADADREAPRTTRRPARAAPTAGPDIDDLDRLLRGRVRRAARREGQHHDPRVHVRDGRVRGHPRLLERGPGRALRAEAPRAHGAHPAQRRDPAHGRTCRRSTSSSGSSSRRPPQRLPRGRLHPAVLLQVGPRRSASGSTTCPTS